MKEKKISEQLRECLGFLDSCESSINYYKDQVEIENKRLQDFLHYIEFESSASERSKKCTEFRQHRLHRRKCKDKVGELQPIVDVIATKEYQKVRHMFSQALGTVRKYEQHEENRKYYNRVKDGD